MSSHDRRSAGRRRAWGRGPIILKFDPLERREVLSAIGQALPDLVSSSIVATPTADWNDPITVSGQITNQGNAPVTQPFQVADLRLAQQQDRPLRRRAGRGDHPRRAGPGAVRPVLHHGQAAGQSHPRGADQRRRLPGCDGRSRKARSRRATSGTTRASAWATTRRRSRSRSPSPPTSSTRRSGSIPPTPSGEAPSRSPPRSRTMPREMRRRRDPRSS